MYTFTYFRLFAFVMAFHEATIWLNEVFYMQKYAIYDWEYQKILKSLGNFTLHLFCKTYETFEFIEESERKICAVK